MTAEKLGPENSPNILKDPVGFVDRVKALSSNNDPGDRSAFKEWLLDQWTEIYLKISTTPYQNIVRSNGRSGGLQRSVRLSDSSSLTQWDTDEEDPGSGIEFLHKNHDTIRILFITSPRTNRDLDKVLIENASLGVNPEGNPPVEHSRFVIKVSPFTIIRADDSVWDFLFPPQHQGATALSSTLRNPE